jgi:hypothetical protein
VKLDHFRRLGHLPRLPIAGAETLPSKQSCLRSCDCAMQNRQDSSSCTIDLGIK